MHKHTFNFDKSIKYQLSPSFDKIINTIDSEIIEIGMINSSRKLLFEYTQKMGTDKFIFIYSAINIFYLLANRDDYEIGIINQDDINKYISSKLKIKRNKAGLIYDVTDEYIKKRGTITKYSFIDKLSFVFSCIVTEYNLIDQNDTCLIMSNNNFVLDGLHYYNKFKLFNTDNSNIQFLFWKYQQDIPFEKEIIAYFGQNSINHKIINYPLTTSKIKTLSGKKYNIVIVDIIAYIEKISHDSIEYKADYIFMISLPFIILGLNSLQPNGNMWIHTFTPTNSKILNFYNYLSHFFVNGNIIDDALDTPILMAPHFCQIIFKNYKGNIDMDALFELINKIFECDETGGFNTECYLSNIVLPTTETKDFYLSYKQFVIQMYDKQFKLLNKMYGLFLNYDTEMNNQIKETRSDSIALAKKYDIDLVDWILAESESKYIKNKIQTYIVNIPLAETNKVSASYAAPIIKLSDTIKISDQKFLLKNMYYSIESTYQYVHRTDVYKFENIEKYINSIQKKLNSYLTDTYNININGKTVSRAWMKMFELLSEIDFFKNISKVNAFFTCEAPGNFIAAMTYYIKNRTNITEFKWIAQSLKPSHGGLDDSYGFIKANKNLWDFGTGNGDIMNIDNFNYYVTKYRDSDIYVSDCGHVWGSMTDKFNDLSVYQALFALLIPREGGNFIFKSFISNINPLYISLLSIIAKKYETVYFFKSNMNFWSSEIYIVGINKLVLKKSETDTLLLIPQELSRKKLVYPCNTINDEYTTEHVRICNKILNVFSNIKNLLLFLSLNDDLYQANKQYIKLIIEDRNQHWINKYIK